MTTFEQSLVKKAATPSESHQAAIGMEIYVMQNGVNEAGNESARKGFNL